MRFRTARAVAGACKTVNIVRLSGPQPRIGVLQTIRPSTRSRSRVGSRWLARSDARGSRTSRRPTARGCASSSCCSASCCWRSSSRSRPGRRSRTSSGS